ncbi:hypothetical protein [Demequina sp. NBRC 110054]|uniref:hypothetical protein n=1 Tax=Demequina sp. NBRC 110054 TaxID=1570343 RepID=UPI001178ABAA|nr:hypothetical protein [Demequina sp. NBRC 110054]
MSGEGGEGPGDGAGTAPVAPRSETRWWSALRRPVAWGSAIGVLVLVVGVSLTAGALMSDGDDDAAPAASATASATASSAAETTTAPISAADASDAPVEDAVPEVTVSASPSASAAPSPSATPESDPARTLDAPEQVDVFADVELSSLAKCTYPSTDDDTLADINFNVSADRGDSTPGEGTDEISWVSDLKKVKPSELDSLEWAPDGQHAVAMLQRNGAQVWLIDADGSATNISKDYSPETLSPVRWSHEGDQLAYVSKNDDGDHDLVVYDLRDGSSTVVATANRINGYDFEPGGLAIAYGGTFTSSRYRMVWSYYTNVYLVDLVDGTEESVLSHVGFPSFAPDGSGLVVFGDADRDGLQGATLIKRASGYEGAYTAGWVNVGPEAEYSGFLLSAWDRHTAVWSPDGDHFAIVTVGGDHRNDTAVVIADASGTVIARSDADTTRRPVWTADSTTLGFGSGSSVYAIAVESGDASKVRIDGLSGSVKVAGNRFIVRAAACDTTDVQSLVVSKDLTAAAPLSLDGDWFDAGVPYASPDGKILRLLIAPGSSGTGLYLMQ